LDPVTSNAEGIVDRIGSVSRLLDGCDEIDIDSFSGTRRCSPRYSILESCFWVNESVLLILLFNDFPPADLSVELFESREEAIFFLFFFFLFFLSLSLLPFIQYYNVKIRKYPGKGKSVKGTSKI